VNGFFEVRVWLGGDGFVLGLGCIEQMLQAGVLRDVLAEGVELGDETPLVAGAGRVGVEQFALALPVVKHALDHVSFLEPNGESGFFDPGRHIAVQPTGWWERCWGLDVCTRDTQTQPTKTVLGSGRVYEGHANSTNKEGKLLSLGRS
jgi:hypothetical protein